MYQSCSCDAPYQGVLSEVASLFDLDSVISSLCNDAVQSFSVSPHLHRSVSESVAYIFSSHLGLIRCLTLIVTVDVSTQHHIHTFREKLGYTHKIILTKELFNVLTCQAGFRKGVSICVL